MLIKRLLSQPKIRPRTKEGKKLPERELEMKMVNSKGCPNEKLVLSLLFRNRRDKILM